MIGIDEQVTSPGERITSDDQLKNWLLDLVSRVKEARARADLAQSPTEQRKWFQSTLLRYGSAKGALDAAYRLGRVEEPFHSTCSMQAIAALSVKVKPS